MKLASGGWRYAIVPFLVSPFAFIYSPLVSGIALLVGAFVLLFFRDPERTPPPSGVVSPADGNVSVIRKEGDRVRLGVFMNVWHVHVIRAPVSGTVDAVEHVPGAHRPAFSKDSDRNERVHVTYREENGADEPWNVTLIAGAFARRIFPYVDAETPLERGERLGHIAFGSRVDVLFPPAVDREDLAVSLGESVTAGETIILDQQTGLELDGRDETPFSDRDESNDSDRR